MTLKNLVKLINKLKQNDSSLFDVYEDIYGPLDPDEIYGTVKDYEYENLGDIIIASIYDSLDNDLSIISSLENKIKRGDDMESDGPSLIKTYFDDIKKTYDKYNNNWNINYNQDEREKIIMMNAKTVITIAKRYQGYGLSLLELISAGNIGLCWAYKKFDPTRNKVKDSLLEVIAPLKDKITYKTLEKAVNQVLTYGDYYNKFVNDFSKSAKINKEEFILWIDKHIKPASFNSVASFWITSEIKKALDNHTKGVVIKDEQYEELQEELKEAKENLEKANTKEEKDKYQREIDILIEILDKIKSVKTNFVRIDNPVAGTNVNQGGEMNLENVIQTDNIEDDEENVVENIDDKNRFYEILDRLFGNTKIRDKRVFLKSFGIGYPGKMTTADISKQEGISVARVSQILSNTMETLKNNIDKYDVDKDFLYSLI